MVRLLDLHVVDRVFDFALIVVSGVTLLSGAAWTVSRRLPRTPAARHLVLSMTKNSRSLTWLVTLLFLSACSIVSATRFAAAGDDLVPKGQAAPAATDRSAAPAPDATEVAHDSRLTRGGPAGFLFTPDGKPAAGAVIVLSSRDEPELSIVNGRLDERQVNSPNATTTGPDGRYSFKGSLTPRSITVLHESGFAAQSLGVARTPPDITLQPWGRIEGVIRLGNSPGSGLEVGASEETQTIYSTGPESRTIRLAPRRHYRSETKADAEGHFVLDRVQPGPGIVYRMLRTAGGGFHTSHIIPVDVPARGTFHVTLGGTGRPVVGRFTSQDGTVPTLAFSSSSALLASRPPLPRPPDYASYSPERKREWIDTFQASDAGKALERQKRRYALVIAPDGTFRADDVPPGRYEMTLTVRETIKEGRRTTIRGSGAFRRVVDVPEVEAGHGAEPVDVGDAVLTPKGSQGLQAGEELPPLIAETLDGVPLALADFKNKYVLLALWASWCAPCRAETPHLKAAFEAFGKDERFVLIGLSLDDTVDAAKQYTVANGLGWTQGFLGRAPAQRVTTDLGVHGIPAIWLIGPDGKLVAKGLRGEKIKEAVAEALAKPR